MKPQLYSAADSDISKLRNELKAENVIDTYLEQLEDLFLIRNPVFKFNPDHKEAFETFKLSHIGSSTLEKMGTWAFFPWNKTLVHFLPDPLHQELRTARNKNIITQTEQDTFYNFNVGIAGLSVGSHAALTIAMMGGARLMKLADPDVISGSNLNRIRYDYSHVGKNKCDLASETIYQMNPYAELIEYRNGVTNDNIIDFLSGPPRLNVLVEEIDNLEMKIRLRLEAKKLGIPVIMATDNGDNIIFDIERYDLDPNLKIFNGAVGDLTIDEFKNMQPFEIPRLATKIAGAGFVMPRMLASILDVGKSLYSWPQLGDAATLSGVAIAYVVRRLALGLPLKSGKMEVNLDEVFDPDYSTSAASTKREEERNSFKKIIGLE